MQAKQQGFDRPPGSPAGKHAAPPPPLLAAPNAPWRADAAAVLLLLLVTLPWWIALRCGFIPFDDPIYIRDNSIVRGGLTWSAFKTAWTVDWGGLWSPITFLSFMLDCTLFGTGSEESLATAMHAINVLFHIANTLLVYFVLSRAVQHGALAENGRGGAGSGAEASAGGGEIRMRAAFVAAVFSIHPLRVESVAWVTERKDMLAAFFGLLAMASYLRYLATRAPRRWAWYAAMCLLFALSLLSKPMVITLPFLLLLLDAWPLGRWTTPANGTTARHWAGWRNMARLVLEKLPLVAIAVAMVIATVGVQSQNGAMVPIPLSIRLQNVVISYAMYLRDHVSFEGLALYYPLRATPPEALLLPATVLVAITAAVALWWWKAGRPSHEYATNTERTQGPRAALVGWLWYLGVFVPMIGLVQTGAQSRADRYSYFPAIGLLMAIAWAVPARWLRLEQARRGLALAAAALVVVLAMNTRARLLLWADPLPLLVHDFELTKPNAMLAFMTGVQLEREDRFVEAEALYRRAVQDLPRFFQAHLNLGSLLVQTRREEEGWREIAIAKQLSPHNELIEDTERRLREVLAQRAASRPR
jgi:hypothetical protein